MQPTVFIKTFIYVFTVKYACFTLSQVILGAKLASDGFLVCVFILDVYLKMKIH